MLFNSLPFLFFFLPISFAGFQVAGYLGRRAVLVWLSLISLAFYAAWNRSYVVLLLGSIVLNFGISRLIARAAPASYARKRYLHLGIALNLVVLFHYKYLFHLLDFLSGTTVWHQIGFGVPHAILLPLGISFFTFTQVAYLIDLAQNQAKEEDFLSYLVFVTFFPHLIAGPLLHHREIMPQFSEGPALCCQADRRFQLRAADMSAGLSLFVFGLAKKVLIADKLAPAADAAFISPHLMGSLDAWAGLLIYCMQLYFDFAGYSDMAIGIAKCFGIRFPWNFNSPWKATSVTEYWQRWHITLTRYVTLYLYNPMLLAIQRKRMRAGKKTSKKALQSPGGFFHMVFLPLMTTMLLTGLWHGAGLQFLIFGALHGLYLSAHQAWKHFRSAGAGTNMSPLRDSHMARILMRIGVLMQVALALVFFRAGSLAAAWRYVAELFGRNGSGNLTYPLSLLAAAFLLAATWYLPNTQEILAMQFTATSESQPVLALRWRPRLSWAVVLGLLFFASLASLDGASSFLYFQF